MDAAVKKENKLPDIILLLVTLILVTVGTAMIYSSSSIIALEKFKDGQYFLKKQLFFVFVGLTSMIIMTRDSLYAIKKMGLSGDVIIFALTVHAADTAFGNEAWRGDSLVEFGSAFLFR